jgi:elongation factor G
LGTPSVAACSGSTAGRRRAESERIAAELRAAHERVLDRVAACDDEVLADALAERRIAPDRLMAVLRREFLAGRSVPVLGGSALWNRGVDWLLDSVVALFPSPKQLARQGLWSTPGAGDPAAPFCGLVFKVQHLDQAWNYLRVVRGELRPGDSWVRSRGGTVAHAEQLWVVQADRHESVAFARPGEIVVLPGEFGLRTGDTIAAPPGVPPLPTPRFPAPVLAVVFEPERAEDRAALGAALRDLAIDDPTLRADVERDRLTVRGMGELHLEIVAELVRERTKLGFQVSKPRVDLRESVARPGRGQVEVRALVAGQEVSAGCEVEVEPVPGAGTAVVVDRVGGSLAQAPLAELRLLMTAGLRVGSMLDMEVRLVGVRCAAAAPSVPLLELAARKALEEAIAAGGALVLEPWVHFELWCPESGATPVLAELAARAGEVELVSAGRLGARIVGKAPLARMLGFVTKLRSMTRGRGRVSMRPSGMRAGS